MKLTEKELKKLILETLDESQYYHDARDFNTDYGYQAIELGQSMGDEDDRDRAAQIDKYVSLKVNKELKKAIEGSTREALQDLTNEAAETIGLFNDENNEEYDIRTYEELKGLYERALMRPFKAMREFDGTQESIDKWYDAMESVERVLYKARDPAIQYLGRITPEYFTISGAYHLGSEWDMMGWDHSYDRKTVKPKTAVKEAENFFRPAIMKTVIGIQSKKSGVDVASMMGLDENDNKK